MKILKSEQTVDIRSRNLQGNTKVVTQIKQQEYTVDEKILEALQILRREIAREESMPAYIIFDNKALTEMAHFLPDSEEIGTVANSCCLLLCSILPVFASLLMWLSMVVRVKSRC
jgi:superfamily II DNA helicase RecQ